MQQVFAPATHAGVVFHARGLRKTYHMGEIEVVALRSISLDLYEGEFVVLLGPSGSGKTTLLNVLGGLDAPTAGEVFFRDHQLTGANDAYLTRFRREHIGFVFQFYNLIPSLTARENVELAAQLVEHPIPAEEALTDVGLSERMDHFPSQLSGGEQQRVAIARAISKRPDCLLCDEPTGALDYATGKLVLDALTRVNALHGSTTVIITHNAAIARIADRVITLHSGEIASISINAKKATADELEW